MDSASDNQAVIEKLISAKLLSAAEWATLIKLRNTHVTNYLQQTGKISAAAAPKFSIEASAALLAAATGPGDSVRVAQGAASGGGGSENQIRDHKASGSSRNSANSANNAAAAAQTRESDGPPVLKLNDSLFSISPIKQEREVKVEKNGSQSAVVKVEVNLKNE